MAAHSQQYYLRGEVRDESGQILQNVAILQHSTGYVYRSGSAGTFGIMTHQLRDTFSFSHPGFRTDTRLINSEDYVHIRLKPAPANATTIRRDRLSSFTKDLQREDQRSWYTGEETYASLLENHFINARRFPTTGLSLNVDRASYSNIRRFLTLNSQVPPDAVRIEEMLNYFNICYQEPEAGKPFHIRPVLSACPWNKDHQLFYINLSSRKLNLDTLPPSNLVFLIDVSGSMDMPNRLPLLKSAFRLLVNNLRDKDTVSIVVYGGATGVMLQPTSGGEKAKINKVIDELEAGGNTPGEAGISTAYRMATLHFVKGGNNRVILATDGDFNVGVKSEEELGELITRYKESGVYLTCLGVGMGNYKDSRIHLLAEKGNGNFAYLDNFREAEKVLLKEFTQTLYTVADDVYMNVSFNPDWVRQYRLIGFDNKVGALRDSLAAVEGGEIGSGHSQQALFELELTPEGKQALGNPGTAMLADVRLNYRLPDKQQAEEMQFSCPLVYTPAADLDHRFQFSSAVALFGALLRNSPFVKEAGWNDVISLAQQPGGTQDLVQQEFIALVQKARQLYAKGKKRKGSSSRD